MENKKVNLASAVNMRINCDEHIGPILERDYKQDFKILDTKLALTYISILISALTYYLDKKFNNDFQNLDYYQYMVYLTSAFYFFTLLTYIYSTMVEKDIKFVGTDASKNKIVISTKLPSDSKPDYTITVQFNDKKLEVTKSFTQLYNKEGFLELSVFKDVIVDQIKLLQKSKN